MIGAHGGLKSRKPNKKLISTPLRVRVSNVLSFSLYNPNKEPYPPTLRSPLFECLDTRKSHQMEDHDVYRFIVNLK